MQLIGEIFVREIAEAKTPNSYMVCGIIRTNPSQPLETETIHLINAECVSVIGGRDIKEISEDNGLDAIMTSPVWSLNIF